MNNFSGFESDANESKSRKIINEMKEIVANSRRIIVERAVSANIRRRSLTMRHISTSQEMSEYDEQASSEQFDTLGELPNFDSRRSHRVLRSEGNVIDLPYIQPSILEYNSNKKS